MNNLLMILISFFLIYLHGVSDCCSGQYELLSDKDPLYSKLIALAKSWQNDVVAKNIRKLSDYTLPEERDIVFKDLNNSNSALYKNLFMDNGCAVSGVSPYAFFKCAKNVDIILEKDILLKNVGNGVTIIYYDKAATNYEYPMSDHKKQYLLNKGYMFSLFFFQEGEFWYASYNFLVE